MKLYDYESHIEDVNLFFKQLLECNDRRIILEEYAEELSKSPKQYPSKD